MEAVLFQEDLGFMVHGLGFRVHDLGFRVEGLERKPFWLLPLYCKNEVKGLQRGKGAPSSQFCLHKWMHIPINGCIYL